MLSHVTYLGYAVDIKACSGCVCEMIGIAMLCEYHAGAVQYALIDELDEQIVAGCGSDR